MLSQDIERPDDSLLLLTDIVTLWVTIRGYSIVAAWMEVYKDTEKTNIMSPLDCVNLFVVHRDHHYYQTETIVTTFTVTIYFFNYAINILFINTQIQEITSATGQ